MIVGSPGRDTIEGGSGDDLLLGLAHDDIYVFKNGYGTDQFADVDGAQSSGEEILDFSGVTNALDISMSISGFTASAGTGNLLSIGNVTSPNVPNLVAGFVWIDQIKLGSGSDTFAITALPSNHRIDIIDVGGNDTYDFDLDEADAAQSVAGVNIDDGAGGADQIDLDLFSTGFDIYLHPQAVLLNNLNVTFTGVETLNLTDHAVATTITTQPGSGPTELQVKSGVTIKSHTGGNIELLARGDFTLQAGGLIQTTGNVTIRGDHTNVVSTTIDLLGTINADNVAVFGNTHNDTVNVTNVTSGSETTISTNAGDDTINIQTRPLTPIRPFMPVRVTIRLMSGRLPQQQTEPRMASGRF